MALSLSVTSALNLTLEGSAGGFSVGAGSDTQKSVEVKYFLTHVGLDFENGSNEEVLKHLAPVREIFPTVDLEFDEIMQRDIDDARVSSDLVPYLLDHKSRDLVKLFPPIIVVVLPVKAYENKPADFYPIVTTNVEVMPEGHEAQIVRSGAKGQEVFEFVQPLQNGKLYEHDLVRLRLNTNKSRLVIVDGQHRAMALLAVYRNLKQDWNDAMKAPYKDYYEEWTPNYIKKFELKNISLPVMFCTFPQLDESFDGEYNVKMAARSIFLTLNKTARQVSASRNRLLDDNDLIALFLRDTLSTIKKGDLHSDSTLEINNIELDQAHDRVKIESPIAVSGVNHIYYLIEHIVLNKLEDVNGAKPRAGNYYLRTDLEPAAFRRLNGRNILGADLADATSRQFYTATAGDLLTKEFRERFGNYIVSAFQKFAPYEAHSGAVFWLSEKLRSQANTRIRPILFEGQGIGRTFAAHTANLAAKIESQEFGADAPKLKEILDRLVSTQKLVDESISKLNFERAERFLSNVSDKRALKIEDGVIHLRVVEFINRLYDNVLTTVAFQTAMIAGFFCELERANLERSKLGLIAVDTQTAFDGFMADINGFFSPSSSREFRRLVEVFQDGLEGEVREWKITPSNSTFRRVVYRGEMQPAQWPKYKYLILEIWRAAGTELEGSLTVERDKSRRQIFASLEHEYQKEFLTRNLKREENLTSADRTEITNAAYEAFKKFLRNVGWLAADVPSKRLLEEAPVVEDAAEAPEVEDESETWEASEEADFEASEDQQD
jgi:hypothetical protein